MRKPFMRKLPPAIIAVVTFLVAACVASSDTSTLASRSSNRLTTGGAPADEGAQQGEFRLGSGDKVRVNVFDAEKLSGEYDIDLSGTLVMPLIGAIPAAGSTPPELADKVARRLRDEHLMDNPQVTIQVLSARPFYILGEVDKPGEYPYRAGLNVVSAIATGGGFKYRADEDYVFIQRYGETKEVKVPVSGAVPVYPGDIVRVPRVFF